jgi:predicted dienelactone hydrolase
MKGFNFAWLLLLALGAAAPGLAQVSHPEAVGLRPDAPTYAKHGPYWVGAREFVIKDAEGGRTLPATFWYPALNPKGMKEATTLTYTDLFANGETSTISGRGIADAPLDPSGGPYPLVIYSHGAHGSRFLWSHHLAHLASHGFMVLGFDHGLKQTYRPQDVLKALEFAAKMNEAGGAFPGMLDAAHTAVEGFSGGGYTALQIGGACMAGLTPGGYKDSRIKAILPMAPWMNPANWDFSAVDLPTLLMTGSDDRDGKEDGTAYCTGTYKVLPSSTKALVVLVGGTHPTFFNPDLARADFGTLDKNRAIDLINHFATAFLLDVLKGDPEAHKALLPEVVKFEEVQYTTTWQ